MSSFRLRDCLMTYLDGAVGKSAWIDVISHTAVVEPHESDMLLVICDPLRTIIRE